LENQNITIKKLLIYIDNIKNATIVAKLIGTSSQATITQILRKYNEPIVQPTRNHKCNKYANQIIELYLNGISSTEITKLLPKSISYVTIINFLRDNGIEINEAGFQEKEENPNWNNGITYDEHGYISIYKPDHPRASYNGYVKKHVLVMEEKLGRYLTKEEVVHHIDENIINNSPENLMLFPNNSEHIRLHWQLRKLKKTKGDFINDNRTRNFLEW